MNGAVADLLASLRFCRCFQGLPSAVVVVQRWRMEDSTLAALQALVSEHCLDGEMFASLEDEVDALLSQEKLAPAFATERVLCTRLSLEEIRQAPFPELVRARLTGRSGGYPIGRDALEIRRNADAEELAYVRAIFALEELADLPYWEALDRYAKLGAEPGPEHSLLLQGAWKGHGEMIKKKAVRQAKWSVARLALAAEGYLKEHGRYPESSPLAIADPFDGRPLRYRLDPEALVIWSVGEGQSDDVPGLADTGPGLSSIVWWIPARARGDAATSQKAAEAAGTALEETRRRRENGDREDEGD